MADNRIAAVVVTYNRLSLLLECLDALDKQTYSNFDILVINNASTDGTEEKLRPFVEQGRILYHNTGKNLGGAGGFNYGVRLAYESGYDYFWLMDDDTIPTPTALEELMNAKEILRDEFGYLSSYAVWTDGSICQMNVPGRLKKGDVFTGYSSDSLVPIKRATFVSFFVPRKIVAQIGLPIKEFFIWADDTNYCLRINRIAQGYWVTKSVVVHKMKNNADTNLVYDEGDRLERYRYNYRNIMFNSRYEHSLGKYYFRVFKRIGRILISSKDRKWLRLKYMLSGVWDGIFFHPEIEYVDETTDGQEKTAIH